MRLANLQIWTVGAVIQGFLILGPLKSDVRAQAAEAPINAAPEFYPWSETGDTVRVPKRFLELITIPTLTMSSEEPRQLRLQQEFIDTFRLTPSEVDRVTDAMADALEQYRMVQREKLELTDDRVVIDPRGAGPGADVIERFDFKLIPFPEEAGAIRARLVESVIGILGEERSRHFWRFADPLLNGQMNLFSEHLRLDGKRSITHAFLLRNVNSSLRVELYQVTMTQRGRGVVGNAYGEGLDRYAPAEMIPVLARWRQKIAQSNGNAIADAISSRARASAKLPTKPGEDSPQPRASGAQPVPAWDDHSPFVDLPKAYITGLRVPGLTVDETVSAEAAILFALTADEQKAIADLYGEMRSRFEDLERKHFQRVDPTKHSYIIRAFPKEAADLRKEWMEKLQTLVGPERSQMLNECIRKTRPVGPFVRLDRNQGARRVPGGPPGPTWLNRGASETRINVTVEQGVGGKRTLKIEHNTGNGERGSSTGSIDAIPGRWRHLLTPAMFQPPQAL